MDKFNIYGRFEINNLNSGESRQCDNTIMNIGKGMLPGFMLNDVTTGSTFDWLSIGLGSNTIVASDTALGSEYQRIPGSGTRITTTVTNDTASISGTFVITDTKIINEIGLFNQSGLDLGSMFARSAFAGLSVGSLDSITATYKVTFS